MTRRIPSWGCVAGVKARPANSFFLLCKLAFLCELGRQPTHLLGLKTEEGARKKVSLSVTSMVALEGTWPICWQPFARMGRDRSVWGGQSKVNPIPRGHSNQIPSRANTSHREGRASAGPWLGAQLQLTLPPAMAPSWRPSQTPLCMWGFAHCSPFSGQALWPWPLRVACWLWPDPGTLLPSLGRPSMWQASPFTALEEEHLC